MCDVLSWNTNLVIAAGDDVDELVHDDGGHAAPVERHYVEVVVAEDRQVGVHVLLRQAHHWNYVQCNHF